MNADHLNSDGRLLAVLAEQLKIPIIQMSRLVELSSNDDELRDQINSTANLALQLIDGLIFSMDRKSQTSLKLEPILLSNILKSSADNLQEHAIKYESKLYVDVASCKLPIMGNYRALKSAFTALGYSMVENYSSVIFSAYNYKGKTYAGVFGENNATRNNNNKSNLIPNKIDQNYVIKSSSNSVGLFIADSIFSNLSTSLTIAKRNKLNGFVSTFAISKQLELI